ncbi:MAG: TIGR02757 family protein [Bacteroidetes bacterium]|nr:TIGR02757 family protein [Bacteroidota bacterium]
MKLTKLKTLLDAKCELYNRPEFIQADPISVPHCFSKKQDIEISGFFAAILAWGNRTSIINSANRILKWMDDAPYQFILHHKPSDLKPFMHFAHRTFNATDLLYFIEFLQRHYQSYTSLEDAFVPDSKYSEVNVGPALIRFRDYFFSQEHPTRTEKHIATPKKNAACKRLNMYLRWMVRKDLQGVDFGIWNKIKPIQLICPLDVHVARVAHRLELLPDEKATWKNAVSLTQQLICLNDSDPVVYDYALFGLGMVERL